MATIRKRSWKSGSETKAAWVCDYSDQKGERHIKTFKTRKEADGWLVQARHQVASGTHLPETTSPTVAQAAERWLASAAARGLERTTLDGYRQHIGHIVPQLGSVKLSRLAEEQVEAFRDHLLATMSRAMAAKVMVSLRSILRQARRPIDVRLDRQPGRHRRKLEVGRDIPTPEQVRALLDAAQPPVRAILALAALTGLRASEIRGLRWDDLDLRAGEVTIRQRADRWGVVGSPKSEEARRTVPFGPELAVILKEHKLASQPGGRELVFPNRVGKPFLLANLRRNVLRGIKLHALRHFYASWQLGLGLPLTTVQRRLGHSTIMLTADIYGHLLPSTSEERAALGAAERVLLGRDKAAT
jgi:integrase